MLVSCLVPAWYRNHGNQATMFGYPNQEFFIFFFSPLIHPDRNYSVTSRQATIGGRHGNPRQILSFIYEDVLNLFVIQLAVQHLIYPIHVTENYCTCFPFRHGQLVTLEIALKKVKVK